MKVMFFSDPCLRVGDLATGFPSEKEFASLLALPSGLTEVALRSACKKLGILLYEVVRVVRRCILFHRIDYCEVRRLTDGKVFRISLTGPPVEWLSRGKEPPPDPRSEWLRLELTPATTQVAPANHFQIKVGSATVHVHQAFEDWANPTIRIESDGEEATLVVDKKDKRVDIEIVKQTP